MFSSPSCTNGFAHPQYQQHDVASTQGGGGGVSGTVFSNFYEIDVT